MRPLGVRGGDGLRLRRGVPPAAPAVARGQVPLEVGLQLPPQEAAPDLPLPSHQQEARTQCLILGGAGAVIAPLARSGIRPRPPSPPRRGFAPLPSPAFPLGASSDRRKEGDGVGVGNLWGRGAGPVFLILVADRVGMAFVGDLYFRLHKRPRCDLFTKHLLHNFPFPF